MPREKRPLGHHPHPALPERQRKTMGPRLLAWYKVHKRSLPWREHPEPYAVWVSEMMLQQTQVDTVLPYFERWMSRFPDLRALADAEEDSVLALWQGLGYYSRARALWRGARALRDSGQSDLPSSAAALRELPGIGEYTAGAISSIAFERDEPVVDGNVARVLCRWLALTSDPSKNPLKKQLWVLARLLLVEGQARDFNQALMELGALVCRPQKPACESCPLASDCKARLDGLIHTLPAIPKRAKATKVVAVAAVLEQKGRVLVVRAPADAKRWSSMWMFPNVDVEDGESADVAVARAVSFWCGLQASAGAQLGSLEHSVTRYRIRLDYYEASWARGKAVARPGSEVRFCTPQELAALAMPAAHRVIARTLDRPHGVEPKRPRAGGRAQAGLTRGQPSPKPRP